MWKYKTKVIQAVLGTFMHIPAYSGIFKDMQNLMLQNLQNLIFRTLAYSD